MAASLPKFASRRTPINRQPLWCDLKQRGLLKDTIVICGGEFGRTIYSQGKLTKDNHGPTTTAAVFPCGLQAGIKAGFEYGKTDDFAYNIVENPVHETIERHGASVSGIDHERFTYRYLGLDQRLTGVEHPKVIPT